MTFSQKIAAIKSKIGHTYSSWAQTFSNVDSYNGDIANAIIYALRDVGKVVPLWQKTILIPLESNKRYYATYVGHYTKDKVEYVRPRLVGILGWNSDSSIRTVGEAETAIYEEIEANQYIDAFKIGQKLFGSEIGFLTSSTTGSLPQGSLSNLVTIASETITVTSISFIIEPGHVVTNLEFPLEPYKLEATVSGVDQSSLILDKDVGSLGWTSGDKLWISKGRAVFLLLEFQAIPKIDYLGSNSDLTKEIPILPQFQDDIDDIIIKHLFTILSMRNHEVLPVYTGLINSGILKHPEKAIADIRRRAEPVGNIVVKSYLPITIRYGR